MELVIRSKDDRRKAQATTFPLKDSDGVIVIRDRRQVADRRKPRCGIADLEVILAKMAR